MIALALLLVLKAFGIKGIILENTCLPNEVFNEYLFECSDKPPFKTDPPMTKNFYTKQWSCPPGHILKDSNCVKCDSGIPSMDRLKCLTCGEGTEQGEKTCNCIKKVQPGVFIQDNDEMKCIKIKYPQAYNNTIGDKYPEEGCSGPQEFKIYGNDGSCQCDKTNVISTILSQNTCIPSSSLVDQNKYPLQLNIVYKSLESKDGMTETTHGSGLINYYYNKAASECFNNVNRELSCQILANLCVLKMYDERASECLLYNDINWNTICNFPPCDNVDETNNPGWKKHMPWLYYQTTRGVYKNASEILMNSARIKFDVAFEISTSPIEIALLQFYMGKFTINGTFIDIIELKDEFILCTNKVNDTTNYRTFGRTIINECFIDLQQYIKRENQMYFYEIFLKNGNPESTELVDVPLLITNIHDDNNQTDDMSKWRLTRRMFLFDNLSGLPTYNPEKTKQANFITYPKEIKFVIELQNIKGQSKIFPPYIKVSYVTRRATDLPTWPDAFISFSSQYSMKLDNFMTVCLALLITITVVAFLIVAARMYVWTQVNPKDIFSKNYWIHFIIAFVFKLFRFWGFIIFWFIWIITAYWYIFFKLQFRVYLLLPLLDNYKDYYEKFDIVFGLGCASFFLYIVYRIYLHASYDIFFIDWEQDKELLEKNLEQKEIRASNYRYKGAWRLLQVVNQYYDLSRKRSVSYYFCVIWVILMYYRVNWWWKDQQVPRVINIEHAPNNFILRHFVTSFIMLVCGVSQFIIIRLMQFWIPLKTVEFLDLCSVANISVFILSDKLRGYYIHGQSVIGKADSNLNDLLKFLEAESTPNARQRGLTGQDTDTQSYNMYISYAMRTVYEGLHLIQTEASAFSNKSKDHIANNTKLGNIMKNIAENGELNNPTNLLTNYMNNQLKYKVEHIKMNQSRCIFNMEGLMAMILDHPSTVNLLQPNSEDITFFHDKRMNFDELLFCGIEFDWFILLMYLFQMWMRVCDNMEISFFLTFICDQILFKIRNYLVERNIGKKAIIDTRFIS